MDVASSVTVATASPQYYIEDGVHRAIAARENNLGVLPAILYVPGQSPQKVFVNLDQLHSPRLSISKSDPRHNYAALEAAMATPIGRTNVRPISLQPLGTPGQTASIPLQNVLIAP